MINYKAIATTADTKIKEDPTKPGGIKFVIPGVVGVATGIGLAVHANKMNKEIAGSAPVSLKSDWTASIGFVLAGTITILSGLFIKWGIWGFSKSTKSDTDH
jgi:hypothetical protein